MTAILYPTRAGDVTHRNQDRVIALAKERQAKLIFLYVSNVRFLDHIASPVPLDLVEEELDELGEFVLIMAQERAEKAGLAAEAVIRRGGFRDALKSVIGEYEVTTVVLGLPAEETAITTVDYIHDVADMLRDETGVEVLIIDQGEIVESFSDRGGSSDPAQE
ncbi:MAG: universal stress protein [Candidatus Promineifilaceae bacterium]